MISCKDYVTVQQTVLLIQKNALILKERSKAIIKIIDYKTSLTLANASSIPAGFFPPA